MTPFEAVKAAADHFSSFPSFKVSSYPRGVSAARDGEIHGFVIQTGSAVVDGEDTSTTYTVDCRLILFVTAQTNPEDAAKTVSDITAYGGDKSIFSVLHDDDGGSTLGNKVRWVEWGFDVDVSFDVDDMEYALTTDFALHIDR